MKPTEITDRYFACMHARDLDGLMALFADDAIFTIPSGRSFESAEAIRQMYAGLFAGNRPTPTPVRAIAAGDAVAVEIEGRLADGAHVNTANFFYFNKAGRIQSVSVYRRGG